MFQTFKSHPKIPMMRFGVLGPGGPEPPMAVACSSKTLKAGMWHLERQLMSTTDVLEIFRDIWDIVAVFCVKSDSMRKSLWYIYICMYIWHFTDVMIIYTHMQFCTWCTLIFGTNHASYLASSAWKLGCVPTSYWWLHRFFNVFLYCFDFYIAASGSNRIVIVSCWRVIMDHMEGAQFGSTFSCASAASLILPRPHVQALKESAARALDFVHPKSGNVGKLRFAADGWQELKQVSMSQCWEHWTVNEDYIITSSLVSLCNASYERTEGSKNVTAANSETGVVALGLEAPAFVYGDTKRKPEGSARDKPSWRREGAGDHHECFGWLQKVYSVQYEIYLYQVCVGWLPRASFSLD